MKRSAINRRGKKTKAWDAARRWLRVKFEERGITSCELRLPGCWQDRTLGFAHSRKRNDPDFEMYEVALACSANCHEIIEHLPHEDMYATVMAVIETRGIIKP